MNTPQISGLVGVTDSTQKLVDDFNASLAGEPNQSAPLDIETCSYLDLQVAKSNRLSADLAAVQSVLRAARQRADLLPVIAADLRTEQRRANKAIDEADGFVRKRLGQGGEGVETMPSYDRNQGHAEKEFSAVVHASEAYADAKSYTAQVASAVRRVAEWMRGCDATIAEAKENLQAVVAKLT